MGLPDQSDKLGKELHDKQVAKKAAEEAAKKAANVEAEKLIDHENDKEQGRI